MSGSKLSFNTRIKMMSKYNFQCAKCESSIDLHVHHIERMTPDNPRYEDLDNLILLCNSCHTKEHRRKGEFPGTRSPHTHCKIEGCNRVHGAHGLCRKHYKYYWTRGYFTKNKKCTEDGCNRASYARSLCNKHYQRYWLYGCL